MTTVSVVPIMTSFSERIYLDTQGGPPLHPIYGSTSSEFNESIVHIDAQSALRQEDGVIAARCHHQFVRSLR